MVADLTSWPRPNFIPEGGDAFLLYAAFGRVDLSVPIDRLKYRSARVPAGFELLLYDRDKQPSSFRQLINSVAWTLARTEAPELGAAAEAARHCVLLRGYARDPETLDYLRDCVGIVQYLFDRGAEAVFDPQMFQFWNAGDWQERLFAPNSAVPHEHVVILQTQSDDPAQDVEWIHTRGMRKFGRADLSIRGVGPAYRDTVFELFNRYVEYQATGGVILDDDVITLDGLPADGVCHVDPRIDHPDFHNAHVEIRWPGTGLR